MASLASGIRWLVYASVGLGVMLVYVASSQVPSWLLAGLIAGELSYAATAVALARGYSGAYYVVFILALLVLGVSLPQPEHYSFATSGQVAAFLIFGTGSTLQICLLVMIPLYLRRQSKR